MYRITSSVEPFPGDPGSGSGCPSVSWMWSLGLGLMGMVVAALLTANPLSGQAGCNDPVSADARTEASTSILLLQGLRPPPPMTPLDFRSAPPGAGWTGSPQGFVGDGSLLLPEQMDFWTGALVGGLWAYHDPFGRFRNDDHRVRRTIVEALLSGLSGQPVYHQELLRHRRPPIDMRAPPHPDW